ncbi:hypothetical protein EDC01DRAFT_677717 [Geopyxis carbonaria]|nr:hypothetical protein EDC01DRAFT_677717 [Geopyxis carbonaria]
MIRPRTGLTAPSQNTLKFLRQIISPRTSEPKCHCLRPQVPDTRSLHHEAAVTRTAAPDVPPKPFHQSPQRPPWTGARQTKQSKPSKQTNQKNAEPKTEAEKQANTKLRRWKTLVANGKLYEARQEFLSSRDDGVDEATVQNMGYTLMLAHHACGRFADVPMMFGYLVRVKNAVQEVSVDSLNLCLDAYRRGGYHTKLISVFQHHTVNIAPNQKTIQLYVRALIETGRLSEAKKALWYNHNGIETLSVSINTAVQFLKGWRRVSTFENFVAEFKYINARIDQPSTLLYNAMIEEALLAGKSKVAKQYLSRMLNDGLKPNGDTFGAFLNVQAILQDYDGVEKTLEQMKAKGFTLSTRRLNRMLTDYALRNQVDDLEQIFNVLLLEGVAPSTTSYNIMVKKNLDGRNWPKAVEWVVAMKKAGFRPNSMTFKLLLKLIWDSRPQSLSPVWWIVKEVFRMNKSLVHRAVTQKDFPVQFQQPDFDLSPEEERSRKFKVVEDMKKALQEERIFDALCIFRESLCFSHPTKELLELATHAYIMMPDTGLVVVPGRDLRQGIPAHDEANTMIFDTISRNVQIEIASTGAREKIRQLVFGTYKLMDFHNMPITHTVCVRAASAFIDARNPLNAVHLLSDVSKTPWGRKFPWNIDALTVLLRAYAAIGDIRGLDWAVNRIIDSKLPTDKIVLKYLKLAANKAEKVQTREVVLRLIAKCRTHRFMLSVPIRKYANTYLNLLRDPDTDER